jgi:hypothetical protein
LLSEVGRVPELLKIVNLIIYLHFPKNGRYTRFSDLITDSGTRPSFIQRFKDNLCIFIGKDIHSKLLKERSRKTEGKAITF